MVFAAPKSSCTHDVLLALEYAVLAQPSAVPDTDVVFPSTIEAVLHPPPPV